MNLDEIPTPETDAFMLEHGRAVAAQKTRPSTWDKLQSLERRLAIEKNRANEMGKLAHANACEAMEYRRLLTIAREALDKLARLGYEPYFGNSDGNIIALNALELTAPKP